MRRCTTCMNPDHAAIDAELLQGVSFRTVAGRHGVSASALYRHRRQCLREHPTVGDILMPDSVDRGWHEWDGTRWQPINRPQIEHLVEVHRTGATWNTGLFGRGSGLHPGARKVYRRRRSS
jgi:hypothetical protein